MKNLVFIFLLLCVSSCDYFDKKKVTSEDILKEDLQTFNWNEVDEYPTFESCNSSTTKLERKQCFEATITSHIASYLMDEKIVVTTDVNDTIAIKILISELGVLNILELNSSDELKAQIPEIDSFLVQSLSSLPKIHPAFKRGQPVKTEFKLPIVIQGN